MLQSLLSICALLSVETYDLSVILYCPVRTNLLLNLPIAIVFLTK